MSTVEEKIRQLGIEIPPAPTPVGAYVPAVRSGKLVYCSGQLGTIDGELITPEGRVPGDVSVEEGRLGGRQAVLNALSALRAEIGSLEEVVRIVRLNVFVNSEPGFGGQAKVADGVSELLEKIFGQEVGRGSRCAIGAVGLPLNAPVELDMIVEVK